MVTYNDPGNDVATEAGVFPPLKTDQNPTKRWLKRHSHLSKRLWLAYLDWVTPELSLADAGALYQDSEASGRQGERSRRGYALFDGAIMEIAARAAARGIPTLFTASTPGEHPFTEHLFALCAAQAMRFFSGGPQTFL